jgi:putative membrane protein
MDRFHAYRWSLLGGIAVCGAVACGSQGADPNVSGESNAQSTQNGGAGDAGKADADASSDGGTQQASSCGAVFQVCTDAQVVGIINALNRGEILEANAVVNKTQNATVRAFAQKMVTDHQQLLAAVASAAQSAGVTAEDTGLSQELNDSARQAASNFATLSGTQLDHSYINHEFFEHVKGSAIVSRVLIPSAQDSGLKTVLETAVTGIEAHAAEALTIQEQLQGRCASTQQGGALDGGACNDAGAMGNGSACGTSDAGTQQGQVDAGDSGTQQGDAGYAKDAGDAGTQGGHIGDGGDAGTQGGYIGDGGGDASVVCAPGTMCYTGQ